MICYFLIKIKMSVTCMWYSNNNPQFVDTKSEISFFRENYYN